MQDNLENCLAAFSEFRIVKEHDAHGWTNVELSHGWRFRRAHSNDARDV